MYDNYLTAIYIALLISPYISIIAIVPYIYRQYRKEKKIHIDKSIYFYLLIIFWLAAFFMTMLPFPDRILVGYMHTRVLQPYPFKALYDFFAKSGFKITDIHTYKEGLKSWYLLSPLLNIIMLLPFGYLLRVVFDQKLKDVLLNAFISSFFFETVQFSGLFFIYPRPYRSFDVDDIITNVLGAVIGWLIAPWVLKHSPLARLTNNVSVKQGGDVSLRRRLPAIITDQFVAMLISGLISYMIKLDWKIKFIVFILIFILSNVVSGLIQYLTQGQTLGYRLTGLKVKSMSGGKLTLHQSLSRSFMLCETFAAPLCMGYILNLCQELDGFPRIALIILNTLIMILYVLLIFSFLINGMTHGSVLYYDRICKTYLALSDRSKITDGLTLIMSAPLTADNVASFSDSILSFLTDHSIDHKSALRVQLLADGTMNDWLDLGLAGNMCELRFDNRMWHKTLFLTVYDPDLYQQIAAMKTSAKSNTPEDPSAKKNEADDLPETYVEMLSGVRLSYEIYSTEITHNIAIDIP